MKTTRLLIAVILLLCLTLAGCQPGQALVGTWTGDETVGVTLKFDESGLMTLTLMGQTVSGEYQVKGANIELIREGNTMDIPYSIQKDVLTVTLGGQEFALTRVPENGTGDALGTDDETGGAQTAG